MSLASQGVKSHHDQIPFDIIRVVTIGRRSNGITIGDAKASHYEVTLKCGTREMVTEYSKGSGHVGILVIRRQALGQQEILGFNWKEPTVKDLQARETVMGNKRVKPIPPQIEELSNCLKNECHSIQDNPTWEDYADNVGLDKDSITDRDSYLRAQTEYNKIRQFLGGEFDAWMEAQNVDATIIKNPAKRVLQLGKCALNGTNKVNAGELTLEIKHDDKPRRDWDTLEAVNGGITVSICGAIWNNRRSDIDCGGQCIDTILKYFPTRQVRRIHELWKEWHLNDMKTGTRAQTEFLEKYLADNASDTELAKKLQADRYGTCCQILTTNELYNDRGYKYGHGWLYKPVPEAVVNELNHLFSHLFSADEQTKAGVEAMFKPDISFHYNHAGFLVVNTVDEQKKVWELQTKAGMDQCIGVDPADYDKLLAVADGLTLEIIEPSNLCNKRNRNV